MFKRYTMLETTALGMQPMALEDVIEYLRNPDHLELTPMASIQAQTEAVGDPALPSAEQAAILAWLGAAFDHWENQFPLEEPLQSRLRRLKPLAATLAITDPDFLIAGRHPLHQLLDQLQLGAVGWQSRLGRAGAAFEQRLEIAVEKALSWFETDDTDLATLCAEVAADIARDVARASRMTQRLAETELGKIKTAEAKQTAAEMINAALQEYQAPPSIGKFLTGPWYESAQLVLLKFGAESAQWRKMTETTTTLLDSVQAPTVEEDPERRQKIFALVTQVPRELKRWLLSLQHDGDSIASAMGMLEYAHMQILRNQPLALEPIQPIPVTLGDSATTVRQTLESVRVDQWFMVDLEGDGPIRMRLVLRMESQGALLFANQAGIRVLKQSFKEFADLLEGGMVTILDSGASFSRSLAITAGINDTDALASLQEATAQQASLEEQERQHREQLQRERERSERLANTAREVQSGQENPDAATPAQEPPATGTIPAEEEEDARLQREWDEARRLQQEKLGLEPASREATAPAHLTLPESAELAPGASPEQDKSAAEPPPGAELDLSAVSLPMGTWLGFHDGDTPLLAKLAVHDKENDNYIFVNRSGIKMRELSAQQLIDLMETGLVDILETRSNFRKEITRVKNQSED